MALCVRQPRRIAMDTTALEAFSITIHPARVSAFHHNATWKMEVTQYFITDDIQTLGLIDEVMLLFSNIGWTSFFMNAWDTHRGPTLEFFTTLKLDYHDSEGPQSICFSAGGEQYNLSTLDIN